MKFLSCPFILISAQIILPFTEWVVLYPQRELFYCVADGLESLQDILAFFQGKFTVPLIRHSKVQSFQGSHLGQH